MKQGVIVAILAVAIAGSGEIAWAAQTPKVSVKSNAVAKKSPKRVNVTYSKNGGKKAAAGVLQLQGKVRGALSADPQSAAQIGATLGEDAEAVLHALNHLAANDARIRTMRGETVAVDTFALA